MRVLKPGGRAIIWDVFAPSSAGAPHGAPIAGPGGPTHGQPAPVGPHRVVGSAHGVPRVVVQPAEVHGPAWLTTLRMLRQFGRMEPQKFELAKAAEEGA